LSAARGVSDALSQRIKLQDVIEQVLRTTLDVLDSVNGSLLILTRIIHDGSSRNRAVATEIGGTSETG
jgi:hypothetical protein